MILLENEETVCVSPLGELEVWRRTLYTGKYGTKSAIWLVHTMNRGPVTLFIPRGKLSGPKSMELSPEFYGREILGEL